MSSACPTRQRLAHLLEGEIPDAEQRALTAHLDQCRQCQGVFDELLAQHPGPIDPEIADLATATTPEPAGQPRSGDVLAAESPLIGQRVGQYHIKNLIATGGMGSVYLAVQEQPRRTVALKLLKRGIASRSALRRFEYEAQILARLRHPGIAQIYEAGTHQEDPAGPGTPFFAMEYIAEAKSITQYAADRKLGTHKRLELFARICDAVHHGHQKGIIHRDLKPTNLLVDAAGQVKVIDFGVARATDSDQAVTTLQTDLGQLIGTLQYMSPEQYDADPAALDTRSDVYALGVVLYELLCERLPYDLTRATIYQAARIIRDQAPPRPSTVSRLITADLETITLKALQKQRDERYQSAGDLGRDVRRYLNHEPIDARPLSFTYQIGKLAQRNKPVTIIAACLLAAIVVGALLVGWQAIRATRAEIALRRDNAKLRNSKDALKRQFNRLEQLQYGAGMDAAREAMFRGQTALLRDKLDNCPVDLRDWDWHRLDRVATRSSLRMPAALLALTQDGEHVVTSGGDGQIRIWSADGAHVQQEISGHEAGVSRVVCHGSQILTAGFDHCVRRWDMATGRPYDQVLRASAPLNCLAIDGDGKWIAAGGQDHRVVIWHATSGTMGVELAPIDSHNAAVIAIAFDALGGHLVSGDRDGTIKVWAVSSKDALHTLSSHHGAVTSVVFGDDSSLIVSAGIDGTLRRWNLKRQTSEVIAGPAVISPDVPPFGAQAITALSLSPDRRRVAVGRVNGGLTVVTVEDGTSVEVNATDGSEGAVGDVAWRPDGGGVVWVNLEGGIRHWDGTVGP